MLAGSGIRDQAYINAAKISTCAARAPLLVLRPINSLAAGCQPSIIAISETTERSVSFDFDRHIWIGHWGFGIWDFGISIWDFRYPIS